MSRDIVAVMKREIADLEADLADDPRFRKLQHLRALVDLYDDSVSHENETGSDFTALRSGGTSGQPAKRGRPRRLSPERQRTLDLAVEIVGASGDTPKPSRDLLGELLESGAIIGGANKLSNLSAMLSHDERFLSHGRAGWTLAHKENSAVAVEAEKGANDEGEAARDEEGGSPSEGDDGDVRKFLSAGPMG